MELFGVVLNLSLCRYRSPSHCFSSSSARVVQKYETEVETEFGAGSAVALVHSLSAQAEPYAVKILDAAIDKFGITQLVSEVSLACVIYLYLWVLLESLLIRLLGKSKVWRRERQQTLILVPSLTCLRYKHCCSCFLFFFFFFSSTDETLM